MHAPSGQAQPAGSVTVNRGSSCAPVKVFLPRAGFTPLAASNAQLEANGYPRRPPASNRKALALWTGVVGHARYFGVPHPVCSNTKHSIIYNRKWAGHVVPKADYGNQLITLSESEWVQPSVPANSNYTNYQTAPGASFWTGMSNDSSILQAGCDTIATSTVQYRCWTEDYPQGTVYEGPIVTPGDTVFVYVEYCGVYSIPNCGQGQTHYYIENVTSGHAQSFINSSPYVAEANADYINERLNGLYLPNFGSILQWDNNFWQTNTQHSLTTTNDRYDMTSNCLSTGTILSEPTSVDSYAQFHQNWYNASPYSNSC
jgi:hypothetical protein